MMRKPILILAVVLVLSLTESSFAKLVREPWCFKCPPGTALTLWQRDRYYCMIPGTNQSAGVPTWAKPSWAKVVWDVPEGRCPEFPYKDPYTRYGNSCFQCPAGFAFTEAVTDYNTQIRYAKISGTWSSNIGNTYVISQIGDSFSWTVVGHKEVGKGKISGINGRKVSAKWGEGGKWSGSATGTIEEVNDKGRGAKIVWSNGAVFTRATN